MYLYFLGAMKLKTRSAKITLFNGKKDSKIQDKATKQTNNNQKIQKSISKRLMDLKQHVKPNQIVQMKSKQIQEEQMQSTNTNFIIKDQYFRVKNEQLQIKGNDIIEESNTVPIAKIPSKMKMQLNEEETVTFNKMFRHKLAQKQQQEKQEALIQTVKKQKQIMKDQKQTDLRCTIKRDSSQNKVKINQTQDISNIVPQNNKVAAILDKQPLRFRYSAFLQDHQKYQISYEHRMLIKLLSIMDNTLDYLKSSRNNKTIFFTYLQSNFKKNSGPQLTYSKLKQLIFLQQSIYELSWQINQTNNKYDLLIKIPMIKCFEERKVQLRIKIVNYLLAKQFQFLAANNLQKVHHNKWADGFDMNSVKIPQKQLPIHPSVKEASVKGMANSQINQIPNVHLRMASAKIKMQYDKKCLKSQDVIKMIYNKPELNKLQEKLYASIRYKQQKLKSFVPCYEKLTKKILKDVLFQTQFLYDSKNVSNMCRVTLEQMLMKNLQQYANETIKKALKLLLSWSDIAYLKQKYTQANICILELKRNKHKDIKQKIEDMCQPIQI